MICSVDAVSLSAVFAVVLSHEVIANRIKNVNSRAFKILFFIFSSKMFLFRSKTHKILIFNTIIHQKYVKVKINSEL